jgi:hypothetical protein
VDTLTRHAEVAVAAVQGVLVAAYTAFAGRGPAALRTCVRETPAAAMHWISGPAASYWICEHIPSHRDA